MGVKHISVPTYVQIKDLETEESADLAREAVQQQVQAAERSLDSLVRFLDRQPAERSAAGAPGEVAALKAGINVFTDRTRQNNTCSRKVAVGLTVWRMSM